VSAVAGGGGSTKASGPARLNGSETTFRRVQKVAGLQLCVSELERRIADMQRVAAKSQDEDGKE